MEIDADRQILLAKHYEQDAFAQAKKAIREAEEWQHRRVLELEKECDAWRFHSHELVLDTQRRVATRVEQIASEAKAAKELLLENRNRLNVHVNDARSAKRVTSFEKLAKTTQDLMRERKTMLATTAHIATVREQSEQDAEDLAQERLDGLRKTAERIQEHRDHLPLEASVKSSGTYWQNRFAHGEYVKALEELAKRLRNTNFFDAIPQPKYEAQNLREMKPPTFTQIPEAEPIMEPTRNTKILKPGAPLPARKSGQDNKLGERAADLIRHMAVENPGMLDVETLQW